MSRVAPIDDALAVLRDALQGRVIGHLFTEKVHDLALKGGMAMRVLSEHARATKDIDLDAGSDLPLAVIQGHVRRAIKSASADLLVNVDITEPKQTTTTARWKIAGDDPRTGARLHLTVEVSHRDRIDPQDVQQLPYTQAGSVGRTITVYTSQALALKKTKALLSTNRMAARDVADLFLLIQAEVEPPVLGLRRWLRDQNTTSADQIKELWSKLEALDQDLFLAEVLPSLPMNVPTNLRQLYEDWDAVRLSVGQHLEKWLKQAGETEEDTEKESEKPHRAAHL